MTASLRPSDVFWPNAARGAAIDYKVRQDLAASLEAIFTRLGDPLGIDRAEGAALTASIRAGPVAPALMAIYADLVEAIYADDDARANILTSALFAAPPPGSGPRLLTLSETDLGPGQSERYVRYALAENDDLELAPLTPARKTVLTHRFDGALALLAAAAPELAGEIRALMREVVLVERAPSCVGEFGGATSFYLWGGMLLNADRLVDRVAFAEAMIHEAAHAYLFGMNLGAALTENRSDVLLSSPLRVDARPVEGVFHATFVLARIVFGLDRLLASDFLRPDEMKATSAAVLSHRLAFEAGLCALQGIARYTPMGRDLMQAAETYMQNRSSCADVM